MTIPTDRKYAETHEWFQLDGDVVTMGITQHAADELTDITYVELPKVGDTIAAGAVIGELESVKATSELFSAIAGTIVEINTSLDEQPELVNSDAFGAGWMIKIKADSLDAFEALLGAADYGKQLS